MKHAVRCLILSLALALVPALTFAGEGKFVDLPAESGKSTKMKMRFVRYTGGTNGQIIVDIRNGDKASQKFQARGLYFVPDGSAESAPQRLGAAGPFQVQKGKDWQDKKDLKMKPGETRRVKLQVFCLDSHRSSPGSSQGFSLAVKRLPKELRKTISTGADKILIKNGQKMPRSKGAIQSHVWESRNKKWIKLQGERKQEKSSSKRPRRYNQRNQILNQEVRSPVQSQELK